MLYSFSLCVNSEIKNRGIISMALRLDELLNGMQLHIISVNNRGVKVQTQNLIGGLEKMSPIFTVTHYNLLVDPVLMRLLVGIGRLNKEAKGIFIFSHEIWQLQT